MRTIKYRGKIDGAWQYWTEDDAHAYEDLSASQFWGMVDRETVGEFAGLKDKHGIEVYEGDIYRNLDNGLIGKFYYMNGPGGYALHTRENNQDGSPYNMLPFAQLDTTNFEVIGNIYEHPELLEAPHAQS